MHRKAIVARFNSQSCVVTLSRADATNSVEGFGELGRTAQTVDIQKDIDDGDNDATTDYVMHVTLNAPVRFYDRTGEPRESSKVEYYCSSSDLDVAYASGVIPNALLCSAPGTSVRVTLDFNQE